jgi:hypothetical protein
MRYNNTLLSFNLVSGPDNRAIYNSPRNLQRAGAQPSPAGFGAPWSRRFACHAGIPTGILRRTSARRRRGNPKGRSTHRVRADSLRRTTLRLFKWHWGAPAFPTAVQASFGAITSTSSLTAAALLCSAASSSSVRRASKIFSMPCAPSLTGTPTNRLWMPYSPSR